MFWPTTVYKSQERYAGINGTAAQGIPTFIFGTLMCRYSLSFLRYKEVNSRNCQCAQVCALHTGPHLASLRKIEMVAVLCTNETTPNFLSFNSPSPAPQGPMDPTGGGGTSADIVPTQIIFGVDPCTRC